MTGGCLSGLYGHLGDGAPLGCHLKISEKNFPNESTLGSFLILTDWASACTGSQIHQRHAAESTSRCGRISLLLGKKPGGSPCNAKKNERLSSRDRLPDSSFDVPAVCQRPRECFLPLGLSHTGWRRPGGPAVSSTPGLPKGDSGREGLWTSVGPQGPLESAQTGPRPLGAPMEGMFVQILQNRRGGGSGWVNLWTP